MSEFKHIRDLGLEVEMIKGAFVSETLERELADLKEVMRMRDAGVSVASLCNTEKSMAEQKIERDNPYWSQGYEDVITAVRREMSLRADRDRLAERVREMEALYEGARRIIRDGGDFNTQQLALDALISGKKGEGK